MTASLKDRVTIEKTAERATPANVSMACELRNRTPAR
jgi:hypothetical protein